MACYPKLCYRSVYLHFIWLPLFYYTFRCFIMEFIGTMCHSVCGITVIFVFVSDFSNDALLLMIYLKTNKYLVNVFILSKQASEGVFCRMVVKENLPGASVILKQKCLLWKKHLFKHVFWSKACIILLCQGHSTLNNKSRGIVNLPLSVYVPNGYFRYWYLQVATLRFRPVASLVYLLEAETLCSFSPTNSSPRMKRN